MWFFNPLILVCVLFGRSYFITLTNGLPEGYVVDIVGRKTKAITGVFAPNPRRNGTQMLLLATKKGTVKVIEDLDESYDENPSRPLDPSYEILDLKVCWEKERGIQSIAVHPDFGSSNYWVYIYYTQYRKDCVESERENGPRNVLARFPMNNETLQLDKNKEEILLVAPPTQSSRNAGGGLAFSRDRFLFLAIGDDKRSGEIVRSHNNLFGKLLRLNDDGTIPKDNPYSNQGISCGNPINDGIVPSSESDYFDLCSEIWSYGFQNPFRIALDTNSTITKFAISDVGKHSYEEINHGGSNYKMKNYGWPDHEGPASIKQEEDDGYIINLVDPFYYYDHGSNDGGCIAGLTYVSNDIFPGIDFLFIDFILLRIYSLIEDDKKPGTYRNETFYRSIHNSSDSINEKRMIDLFFGPYKDTQALYVIKYGNNNSIIRIRYDTIEDFSDSNQSNYSSHEHDNEEYITKEMFFDSFEPNITFNGYNSSGILTCLDHSEPCEFDAECCSGYCGEVSLCDGDERGDLHFSFDDPFSYLHPLNETTTVISSPTPLPTYLINNTLVEVPADIFSRPHFPNSFSNLDNDTLIDLASMSGEKDSLEEISDDDTQAGLTVTGKWLLAFTIILLCIAPCYLSYKYLHLRRKLSFETKKRSNDNSCASTFCPETRLPIFTTIDDVDTCIESRVNESFSSSCHNYDSPIWNKISEENDRRVQLRAKISRNSLRHVSEESNIRMMTGTPSTADIESLDDSPLSTESLTAKIDDNLVKLDELLSKTFSKQLARSNSKLQNKNSRIGSKVRLDFDSSGNLEDDLNLAPNWLSSSIGRSHQSPSRQINCVNNPDERNVIFDGDLDEIVCE